MRHFSKLWNNYTRPKFQCVIREFKILQKFDDIKDFARYYNLQDRLSFPLDKTTDECMENHLIHLPSGKTIEAVGTIDI